jgi:hypothetical protein
MTHLKNIEAWNKYIEKECVKLVINQNCVKMHGQQNIKFIMSVCVRLSAWNNSALTEQIFMEFDIWAFLKNL